MIDTFAGMDSTSTARMDLPLLLCVLLLSIDTGHSNHLQNSCGGVKDVGNIRLVEPRQTLRDGVVQICNKAIYDNKSQIAWSYLNSTESWNMTAARVACRQLGLPHSAPKVTTLALQSAVQEIVIIRPVSCNGTEVKLRDCLRGQYNISLIDSVMVAGLSCTLDCRNGSLRLIDGPTPWEGKLNMCLNGRWGTVCGDGWTEIEAALVCSRLGYPEINARLQTFGQGSGRQYNCTANGNLADCTIRRTPRTCNHTGISCSSYQETANNKTVNSTDALGAISGVLVVALIALIVVVTAWIITCVHAKRTRTQAPKPPTNSTAPILNNPVYGMDARTQQVTNNNSVGPTYEQIDEAGNRYDVIGIRVDPVTNGEHTYNVLHHAGRSGDSHMTEANTTPQDYEVPT